MRTVPIYQSPLVSQEGHHIASPLHIIHMPSQEKNLSEKKAPLDTVQLSMQVDRSESTLLPSVKHNDSLFQAL